MHTAIEFGHAGTFPQDCEFGCIAAAFGFAVTLVTGTFVAIAIALVTVNYNLFAVAAKGCLLGCHTSRFGRWH
jgi:hypothetical protein